MTTNAPVLETNTAISTHETNDAPTAVSKTPTATDNLVEAKSWNTYNHRGYGSMVSREVITHYYVPSKELYVRINKSYPDSQDSYMSHRDFKLVEAMDRLDDNKNRSYFPVKVSTEWIDHCERYIKLQEQAQELKKFINANLPSLETDEEKLQRLHHQITNIQMHIIQPRPGVKYDREKQLKEQYELYWECSKIPNPRQARDLYEAASCLATLHDDRCLDLLEQAAAQGYKEFDRASSFSATNWKHYEQHPRFIKVCGKVTVPQGFSWSG